MGSARPAVAHRAGRLDDLALPGRKSEYLLAVAEAALDVLLDGAALRALDSGRAIRRAARQGLGPFAAELVTCPDWLQSEGSGSGPLTGSWG